LNRYDLMCVVLVQLFSIEFYCNIFDGKILILYLIKYFFLKYRLYF